MSTNPNPVPDRFCDLVMKGGITSGVVYPLAACELSKAFRFKNIGGTSAGAIAAAATAAAELGRDSAKGGFRLLQDLPKFLGDIPAGDPNPNLFHFFQPQKGTKPLFDIGVAALGNGWGAVPRVLLAATKGFLSWMLLGMLPGFFFILLAWQRTSGIFFLVCLEMGLFFAIGLGLLSTAYGFYLQVTNDVPDNFFGLCTGMEGVQSRKAGQALTPWLTAYLNRLAGRPGDAPPVTFGDLWGTNDPTAERHINLEMMTTCLSHGRPYRLPFRDDGVVKETHQFFFRVEEFEQLFPQQVVTWLKDHPRPPRDADAAARETRFLQAGYHPLPEPWNMPIVAAVRMSLSFPLLLSAVPLHAIDFSRVKEEDRKLERCWFSDGGISSNFPVHFFDSPLPRWPTFAITLTEKHPDHPAGIYLRKNNSAGSERWIRFEWDPEKREQLPGSTQLKGFLGAILGAMQDWSDNTQARLPGFRDRIAAVTLTDEEGGLNLNMPPPRIAALSERGRGVGMEFAKRFASSNPGSILTWPNHRWVRLRSALAALEENLFKINRSCAAPLTGDTPYDVWAGTATNDELPSYRWQPVSGSTDWKYQRQKATDMLAALRRCSQALQEGQAEPMPLNVGAPRPRPELRVRPRV